MRSQQGLQTTGTYTIIESSQHNSNSIRITIGFIQEIEILLGGGGEKGRVEHCSASETSWYDLMRIDCPCEGTEPAVIDFDGCSITDS